MTKSSSSKFSDSSEKFLRDSSILLIIEFREFSLPPITFSRTSILCFALSIVSEKFSILDVKFSFVLVSKTELTAIKSESALTTIDSIFSCKGDSLSFTSSVRPGAISDCKVSPLTARFFPSTGIIANALPPINPVS